MNTMKREKFCVFLILFYEGELLVKRFMHTKKKNIV
ncbi:hypothetical protein WSI_04800 [Candidatus Liberibacter asiaticus str. gxpsy]|uniref:Uncharacterized protein n=2 Tax=Liberibacter asiaticus TaxID=34021 RepID=C6XGR2_LIBAP|nr:hypothetical protein CLIBASIA_04970 [Candidatus Liberibacter asiaticus str. psy62]AGH17328.1 hypothetical protein WSI_04800 [Candidatus Liberibacter asiaticus str. gxpsy]BAP26861.1 hypothetical protein CGUJ_04970 [Candidatus Liberibacter asiaticus str. Ishi-1]